MGAWLKGELKPLVANLLSAESINARRDAIRGVVGDEPLALDDESVRVSVLPRQADAQAPRPGDVRVIDAPRQMLHARHLAFVHPITGTRVETESPLPTDFRAALTALRRLDPARAAGPRGSGSARRRR